jgi:FkbM family methyltransferase
MLTTRTKVSLASAAYKCIAMGRAIAGKNDIVTINRGNVRWCLDLREGIDFSIYLLGAFERSTRATLRKLVNRGDVVFDIGANIGAHTLGLAQSVGPSGRVFAIEPTDFAFAKLKHNLALNPELEQRCSAYQILLAATPVTAAEQELYASWPLKSDDAVHPRHRGRLMKTNNAKVDTLDCFVGRQSIDRLNLIKLDVDGHELAVLQGAVGALSRFRPVLVMEIAPYMHAERSGDFNAVIALLRNAGYSLYDMHSGKPLPLQAPELEALIPEGAGINAVARPGQPEQR